MDRENRVFQCIILTLKIGVIKVLCFKLWPNTINESRYLKYFTNEEQPYSENAIVAIMCYSGYNVEDAIIINEFITKGLFNTTYFNMYEDHENLKLVVVKLIHNL